MFKNFGRRLQHDLQKIVATRQPPGGSPVEVQEKLYTPALSSLKQHPHSNHLGSGLTAFLRQHCRQSRAELQHGNTSSHVLAGARGGRATLWCVVWRLRSGHDAAVWQHVLQVHYNLSMLHSFPVTLWATS